MNDSHSPRPPRNRRRRRPTSGQAAAQTKKPASRRYGQSSRRRRPDDRKPKGSLFSVFHELQQKYLNSRKAYFNAFDRKHPQQVASLERKFYRAQQALRDFETKLTVEQREQIILAQKIYVADHTYSQNHELEVEGQASDAPVEDPHFLLSQKEALKEYAEDQEESVGSFEDYESYKTS